MSYVSFNKHCRPASEGLANRTEDTGCELRFASTTLHYRPHGLLTCIPPYSLRPSSTGLFFAKPGCRTEWVHVHLMPLHPRNEIDFSVEIHFLPSKNYSQPTSSPCIFIWLLTIGVCHSHFSATLHA